MAKTKTKKKDDEPSERTSGETLTQPGKDIIDTTLENLKEEAHAEIPKEEFKPEQMRQSGNIKILKAKITKHQTLEVEYRETYEDGTHSDVAKKCESLIHKDLTSVFGQLEAHLVVICEQPESNAAGEVITGDLPFFDINYSVTGFVITGEAENEGVILIGAKDLKNGAQLNLITPIVKWESSYEFISELGQSIQACIHEVKEYLGGKCAVKQIEMPFE